MTWGAAIAALLKALADFFLGRMAQKDQAAALEAKGRAEGAAELQQTIAEAADAQAQINAADRGGAADVLERLHHRIPPRSP